MRCARCKGEFPDDELRRPSILLRVFAFPYLLLMQAASVIRESNAGYCRPCRRQMNVCLLFLGFLVVIFGITLLIARLR